MAQFTPGHLHIERHALNKDDHSYNFCVDYEVAQDPQDGKGMQFRLHGTIEDKPVDESFFLPKDKFFDFARSIDTIATKNGLPTKGIATSAHNMHYDAMFEDIRAQLNVKSGDPINPAHLE